MPLRVPATTVLTCLLAATVPLATASSAGAAPATVSARAAWQMNEAAGARVMHDSSGHHLDGQIGADVRTHVVAGSRTGYSFAALPNDPASPDDPGHLVVVPSDPALDPGDADFSVTVVARFGADADGRNLVQKGQSGTAGGFWKLEVADAGTVDCLFRGSLGSGGGASGRLDDSRWHTITCSRTAAGVSLTVDGVQVAMHEGPTGTIANAAPLAIGGKPSCAAATVQCDYYAGLLDKVVLR